MPEGMWTAHIGIFTGVAAEDPAPAQTLRVYAKVSLNSTVLFTTNSVDLPNTSTSTPVL